MKEDNFRTKINNAQDLLDELNRLKANRWDLPNIKVTLDTQIVDQYYKAEETEVTLHTHLTTHSEYSQYNELTLLCLKARGFFLHRTMPYKSSAFAHPEGAKCIFSESISYPSQATKLQKLKKALAIVKDVMLN